MALPEQLQKQVDEAKAILESHGLPTEPVVPGQQRPAEGTPAPQSVALAAGQQAPQGQQAAQASAGEETYEQRWRSLQGIYNRAIQDNRGLTARLQQLEQLIAQMQAAPAPQSAPQPMTAAPSQTLLTEKDREEYGDEMLDLVRRAAQQENAALHQQMQGMVAEIQRLRSVVPTVQQVAQDNAQTKEATFFNTLAQYVPDWQQINDHPSFHQWLLTADPMTGITRQTYLEDAQKSKDVARAINIFTAFKSQLTPPQVQTQSGAPQGRPSTPQEELARQVAPGRSLSAPPTALGQAAKQWTRSEITAFYDEVRRGLYKGREAERNSIERDIFAAQREGRLAAA